MPFPFVKDLPFGFPFFTTFITFFGAMADHSYTLNQILTNTNCTMKAFNPLLKGPKQPMSNSVYCFQPLLKRANEIYM